MSWFLTICDRRHWLAIALCSVFGYFRPVWMLAICAFVFITIDTFTGIWSSIKEGTPITSRKLQRLITKITCTLITVVLSFMLEKEMLPFDNNFLSKMCCLMICGCEFYSILENFYRITGLPAFKFMGSVAAKKIKEKTGVIIKQIEYINKRKRK